VTIGAALLHVRKILRTTPEENTDDRRSRARTSPAHGREVVYDAEHSLMLQGQPGPMPCGRWRGQRGGATI